MVMKTYTKILIADDEDDIIEILMYHFKRAGFEVFTANNGREAIEIALEKNPDFILLDIMMPEVDGIETCRRLRENPKFKHTPIFFLTARSEEYSEVAAFEAGADQYIIKPVKPRAIVSRIQAWIRRQVDMGKMNQEGVIQIQDIAIVRDAYSVLKDGEEIIFPRREFELLYLLASKPDKTFQREEILTTIWGEDVQVVDRTIDVHIRKIREKLGDNYIQTVKGVGYKFMSN